MKKLLLITMLIICLSLTVTVFAKTDNEILFREIPWGSSYSEVEQLLPDFDWYPMSFEYMRHYPVCEVLTDSTSGFDDDFTYGGINITAQPFSNKETEVAGYTTSDIELYFAFTSVNGVENQDYNDTAFYGARYSFEPANLQGMTDDLTEKLSSLYGEPDDTKKDTDLWGNKTTIIYWYGANDTVVTLRSVNSENDSTGLYNDELFIAYAWEKGDELLKDIDNKMKESASTGESANFGNGNTNGL